MIALLASALVAFQHPLPPPDRLIPPPGREVPAPDRVELTAGVEALGKRIDALKGKSDLWPDIEIFRKAVAWSLQDNTIYNPREIASAKDQLAEGLKRADALERGVPYWNAQKGLVVRGYISKIDGSVQPYGLVVPDNWSLRGETRHRLDFFFHGRGEQLTELAFVGEHMRSPGEFTPPGAFVLHPYGRFCNANHLAGEVDVFEALDDARRRYRIDDERIVIRGFSMGGASAWHFAVHHADRWAAAAPGAGFSETPQFVGAYRNGQTYPDWQVKLWKLYDATDWASNLSILPLVAYNGDKDGQKQAADMMEASMTAEGLTLPRIVGPNTGHWYHKDSKVEINAFVDAAVAKGRITDPPKLSFTTWTLRYNHYYWLTVDGLQKHWERATVATERSGEAVTLTTKNVSALSLNLPTRPRSVTIDGQKLGATTHYVRAAGGRWSAGEAKGVRKQHGLQGPIDDAFLDTFVFVRPTGTPLTAATGAWAKATREQALKDWHRYLRGEVREVDDTRVDAALLRDANLVLWGDPSSNALWRRIAGKLPLRWTEKGLELNGKTYGPDEAAPALILPNPLNPKRYIVLNTGFTFHDYASDNNALHTPKLPDWAAIRLKTGPTQVLDAGFFDESWRLSNR